jgi:hypothetical protein
MASFNGDTDGMHSAKRLCTGGQITNNSNDTNNNSNNSLNNGNGMDLDKRVSRFSLHVSREISEFPF